MSKQKRKTPSILELSNEIYAERFNELFISSLDGKRNGYFKHGGGWIEIYERQMHDCIIEYIRENPNKYNIDISIGLVNNLILGIQERGLRFDFYKEMDTKTSFVYLNDGNIYSFTTGKISTPLEINKYMAFNKVDLSKAEFDAIDVADFEKTKLYELFLDWLPDKSYIPAIIFYLGNALVGNEYQKLLFFKGLGGCGIGSFNRMVKYILPDFVGTLDQRYFVAPKHDVPHSHGYLNLHNKRIALAEDSPSGEWHLYEQASKTLTGHDPIGARHMRGEIKPITLKLLPILFGNTYPLIRSVDNSITRRLRAVYFEKIIAKSKREYKTNEMNDIYKDGKKVLLKKILLAGHKYIKNNTIPECDGILETSKFYLNQTDALKRYIYDALEGITDDRIKLSYLKERIKSFGYKNNGLARDLRIKMKEMGFADPVRREQGFYYNLLKDGKNILTFDI